MFSFFKKKKEKFSLIIDIQSGLIRGSLIVQKENSSPIISKVITKIIPRKSHTNSHYLNKMMIKTLSDVLSILTENNPISMVHIVLSSPWILSYSKTIDVNFVSDTEITQKMITKIIDDERTKLENRYRGLDVGEQDNIYSDLQYIEQKIFDIKLNGYEVNEYIGKSVKNLQISFSMTLSSKTILNRLNKTISRFTGTKDVRYHSGLLLNYIALRKMLPSMNNYVYMHVHSELTDVIIVQKGLCSHFSSFPMGTAGLIRKISNRMKQTDSVTDSTIALYQGNKLESGETIKVKGIIDEYSKAWFSLYGRTLEMANIINSAPRVYLLSTHSHLEIYKNILNTMTEDEIEITDFGLEKINSRITFDKASEKNQLIEMYAYALDDML